MQAAPLNTDEQLAQRFVSDRVENFKRLYLAIKKRVLQVVDAYLETYFPFEQEASEMIKAIRETSDEPEMVGLYQRFLQFLPIRFRVAAQGRYLYQEPPAEEKKLNAKEPVVSDPRELLKDEMADLNIDPSIFDEVAALENSSGTFEEKRQKFESILFDALGGQLSTETTEEMKKALDEALADRQFDLTTEPGE